MTLEYTFDKKLLEKDMQTYLTAYGYNLLHAEYKEAVNKFNSVIKQYYKSYPNRRHYNVFNSRGELNYTAQKWNRTYDVRDNIVNKKWKYDSAKGYIEAEVGIDPLDTKVKDHDSWSNYEIINNKIYNLDTIDAGTVVRTVLDGYHGAKFVVEKNGIPIMKPSPHDILQEYVDNNKFIIKSFYNNAKTYAQKQKYQLLYFI